MSEEDTSRDTMEVKSEEGVPMPPAPPPKPTTLTNASTAVDVSKLMPEESKVEEMYESVLDNMLTPPQVKKQLIATQSIEKKWQVVQMHGAAGGSGESSTGVAVGSTTGGWGSRENLLLASIEKAKAPDIESLSRLKLSLSSANKAFMEQFLGAGGVSVLMKSMDTCINKRPVTELDVAILYEIMACCKAVMNNQVGMDGFLAVNGAIATVARCLRFDYRLFAIQVLEILSVCCYYSSQASLQVMNGMRLLARTKNEAPYACLCAALLGQDVEVRSVVMVFVNSMIMGIGADDVNANALLRSDLDCVLFGECYDQATAQLEEELLLLQELEEEARDSNISLWDATNPTPGLAGPEALAASPPPPPSVANHRPSIASAAGAGVGAAFRRFSSSVGGRTLSPARNSILGGGSSSSSGSAAGGGGVVGSSSSSSGGNIQRSKSGSISVVGANRSTLTAGTAGSGGASGGAASMESEELLLRRTSIVRSKSIKAIYGPRAISTQKVDAILKSPQLLALATIQEGSGGGSGGGGGASATIYEAESELEIQATIDGVSEMVAVNPLRGTMAGLLVASKNTEKLENKLGLLDMVGGKKTKRRWYELEEDEFKWCTGHEKESQGYKGIISAASITDVRNYTTDVNLVQSTPYAFEFDTADRTFALGCETAAEKDHWVTALQVARDNCIMTKGTYKIQSRELSPKDVPKFAANFRKQGTVYHSICLEHRRAATADSGLDLSSSKRVMEFLRLETLAAGHTDLLLGIMQELLLIPESARGTWEAAYQGVRALCEQGVRQSSAGAAVFSAPSITELLNKKAEEKQPVAYAQMSKLAMVAMESEQEAQRLRAAVDQLEERVAQLEAGGAVATSSTTTTTTAAASASASTTAADADVDAADSVVPPAEESSAAVASAATSGQPDERYAKYVKMQKMLPEGAVRQKMTVDGFSDAEIDSFFTNGPPMKGAIAAGAGAPKPPTLSPAEAIKFAKYEKMLKMLPEGAVRQKMTADGFAEADIDKFFAAKNAASTTTGAKKKASGPAAPVVELPPEGMKPKPKLTAPAGVKLKGLFWSKLKNSQVVPGTVWHQMVEPKLPEEEIARLAELFGTKLATTAEKEAADKLAKEKAAKKQNKTQLVSCLDAQRTQNIMIIMGKLRLSAEQILKLVIDLDPEELHPELTHTLFEVIPTPDELAAVKVHKDPRLLDNASKLLFQFNRMPRILPRLECHEIAFSWPTAASSAASHLGVLECACKELQRSEAEMKRLLAIVLAIGNQLNGGTPRGQAFGVGLDVFVKFQNLKATGVQETLMHFLARQAESVQLAHNWVACWASADISLKQVVADVATLDAQVNKMNSEFIRIKDSRDNIGLDGKMEDCRGPAMNPLHRRLSKFLDAAKPRVAGLKSQIKSVESGVGQLMRIYGETYKSGGNTENGSDDGSGDPCKSFFSCICSFARSFRAAVDEIVEKRLAEEKAAKALEEANNKKTHAHSTAAGGGHKEQKKGKTENIFGMFQAAQEASSEDVIAEFKMKLAKRNMMNNN